MKVLIWILTTVVFVSLNTLLGVATGFKLGYLLILIPIWYIAKKLCGKWDEHTRKKVFLRMQGESSRTMSQQQTAMPGSAQWQCSCGKLHYRYESACICGKSRIDILLAKEPPKIVSEEKTAPTEADEPTPDIISFCRKCGCKLLDDAVFCNRCGTQITKE